VLGGEEAGRLDAWAVPLLAPHASGARIANGDDEGNQRLDGVFAALADARARMAAMRWAATSSRWHMTAATCWRCWRWHAVAAWWKERISAAGHRAAVRDGETSSAAPRPCAICWPTRSIARTCKHATCRW
jgi:hypothetical protein